MKSERRLNLLLALIVFLGVNTFAVILVLFLTANGNYGLFSEGDREGKDYEFGDQHATGPSMFEKLFSARKSRHSGHCWPRVRRGYQEYYSSNHTLSLEDAKHFCREECQGAFIATPARLLHIGFLLNVSGHDKVWTGFQTVDNEGREWRPSFQDGLPRNWLKAFWVRGFPDVIPDTPTTCTYMEKRRKLLIGSLCEDQHYFICLKNLS